MRLRARPTRTLATRSRGTEEGGRGGAEGRWVRREGWRRREGGLEERERGGAEGGWVRGDGKVG